MTASTMPSRADTAPIPTRASRVRWAIADAWTLTLRGLTYWRREPTQIVAGMGFMIMLVVLFAFLFGGAMTVPGGGQLPRLPDARHVRDDDGLRRGRDDGRGQSRTPTRA